MGEVAGRMATPRLRPVAWRARRVGRELLLGGVPGTPAAVAIIGGGVVGMEAAKIAVGMRAIVRVLDIDPRRLAYLSDIFGGRADLVIPNRARTASYVAESDVVIGAVLVHGAKAPKLVSRDMVASMRERSVVVDVAIDQGGCIEPARPTTHSDPTYVERGRPLLRRQHPRGGGEDIDARAHERHVAVPDRMADKGIEGAVREDPALAKGPLDSGRQPRLGAGRRGPLSAPTLRSY